MRIKLIIAKLISFIIACCCLSGKSEKSMKTSDYFETGPQRLLAEAAAKGRENDIKSLLSNGAMINYQGKEGMTALIWALLQQNKDGVKYLLNNGANPNMQMTESSLTSDGLTDGNTAVSLAAMHNDPWFLEAILQHGGDPNIVNPVNGLTSIFQCIMLFDKKYSRLDQLKLLIAAGANLDATDRNGFTPIMNAAKANRYDMVYIMLEAGADPKIKIKSGATIVNVIKLIRTDPKSELYQWRTKVIDLLKTKGVDVNGA